MANILQQSSMAFTFLLLYCTISICYLSCNANTPNGNQAIALVDSEVKDEETNDLIGQNVDEQDLNVFKPTSEWQTVLEGQAIPAGLHVRMNLATGHKEAKLLDDQKEKKQRSTGPNFQSGTPYTKKELKELLQNMPNDNKAGEVYIFNAAMIIFFFTAYIQYVL